MSYGLLRRTSHMVSFCWRGAAGSVKDHRQCKYCNAHHAFRTLHAALKLIEYLDSNWIMDQKVSYEEIERCVYNGNLDVDVDSAPHMVMGPFLEGGESQMLADAADVNDPNNLEMHNSAWNCGDS